MRLVPHLNNRWPTVTVYDSSTNAEIIPSSVVGTSVNALTITFGVAVAITGTVVG